ncbi:hypothetical protein HK405_005559 [Cladochytrium tenue]|nr:hypothetical protein HK405_005559 [Cladochytrium tenue]
MADNEESDSDNAEFSTKFQLDQVLGASYANLRSSVTTPAVAVDMTASKTFKARLQSWLFDQHKVALKALILLVLSIVFFYTSAGLAVKFLADIQAAEGDIYWGMHRPVLLTQSLFLLREALVNATLSGTSIELALENATVLNSTGLPRTPYPLAKWSTLQTVTDSLTWFDTILVYGSAVSAGQLAPLAGQDVSSTSFGLEFASACVDGVTPNDCITVDRGIMLKGLNAALRRYAQAALALRGQLDGLASGGSSVGDAVALLDDVDAQVEYLRWLAADYIFPALVYFTEHRADDISNWAEWFSAFHLILAVIYIAVLVLIHLAVIRPLINSLAEDIKRTSALVYMLPNQIFKTVPSFRRWAEQNMDEPPRNNSLSPAAAAAAATKSGDQGMGKGATFMSSDASSVRVPIASAPL